MLLLLTRAPTRLSRRDGFRKWVLSLEFTPDNSSCNAHTDSSNGLLPTSKHVWRVGGNFQEAAEATWTDLMARYVALF